MWRNPIPRLRLTGVKIVDRGEVVILYMPTECAKAHTNVHPWDHHSGDTSSYQFQDAAFSCRQYIKIPLMIGVCAVVGLRKTAARISCVNVTSVKYLYFLFVRSRRLRYLAIKLQHAKRNCDGQRLRCHRSHSSYSWKLVAFTSHSTYVTQNSVSYHIPECLLYLIPRDSIYIGGFYIEIVTLPGGSIILEVIVYELFSIFVPKHIVWAVKRPTKRVSYVIALEIEGEDWC